MTATTTNHHPSNPSQESIDRVQRAATQPIIPPLDFSQFIKRTEAAPTHSSAQPSPCDISSTTSSSYSSQHDANHLLNESMSSVDTSHEQGHSNSHQQLTQQVVQTTEEISTTANMTTCSPKFAASEMYLNCEDQFRAGLSSCKANILQYVKDHFLVKYNVELNNTRSKLNATTSRLQTLTSEYGALEQKLSQVKKELEKVKTFDDSAQEVAHWKAKYEEALLEQSGIRLENKRMKEERNTLALENKKLRKEKETLARELDITLLKMSKMSHHHHPSNHQDNRSLTPQQQQQRLIQDQQRFIKKLTGNFTTSPPSQENHGSSGSTISPTKPIEFQSERESDIAMNLEIFVSRVEQLKPILVLLKQSDDEFREYLETFLKNVVDILIREKENPFAPSKTEHNTVEEVSFLNRHRATALAPEHEISLRQIMWAMIGDPALDKDDVLFRDHKDGEKKKSKKYVSQKKYLIKKMKELEEHRYTVEEMKKYIEKRIRRRDELWNMVENDVTQLLTQPSIGRLSESGVGSPTRPNIAPNEVNKPSPRDRTQVNTFALEDTPQKTSTEDSLDDDNWEHRNRESSTITTTNNSNRDRNEQVKELDSSRRAPSSDLSVQYAKAQMFASFANNIPSILDFSTTGVGSGSTKNSASAYLQRPNITNNSNLFDRGASSSTTPQKSSTPKGNPSTAAISTFQRDKRVEIFRKRVAASKATAGVKSSPFAASPSIHSATPPPRATQTTPLRSSSFMSPGHVTSSQLFSSQNFSEF